MLELGNSTAVRRETVPVGEQMINFYANRKHRYIQRELKAMQDLLLRIFDPEFTQAIGHHGELMFDAAFGRHGFRGEAQNTRSWNGRTWERTNHNLDRIVTRDGIGYGVEMRFAPKSYMHEIYKSGGFGLLFEEQIYPWGHSTLLKEVRERLGLKVQSPRSVKDGDMKRLVDWHTKQIHRG